MRITGIDGARKLYEYPMNNRRSIITAIGVILSGAVAFWLSQSFSVKNCQDKIDFTVMTCNIGIEECGSVPPKGIQDITSWVLKTGRPNILFLQEVMGLVSANGLAIRLNYPYAVDGRSLSSRTSQVILSDFPLTEPDNLDFSDENTGDAAVCAMAEISGRRILLCTLHLQTLSSKLQKNAKGGYTFSGLAKVTVDEIFHDNQHMVDTQKFLHWINRKNWDAAVIGGDFNTVFMAKSIRLMNKSFNDALWPSVDFFKGTKISKYNLPIGLRIDYLFSSENVSVSSAAVLSQPIGDHLPVAAKLSLCQRGN